MARKLTGQDAFDEVMELVGVLTQPTTDDQEDAAVKRLALLAQEVIEMGAPARASQLIAEIGAFRGIQPSWKTNGKHNFALYVKELLPQLGEVLALTKTNTADVIWKTAEILRGAFREPEYRTVILPFTVLRRLDCLLQPTKAAVIAKHQEISAKGYDLRMFLAPLTGFPFWNHSNFTIKGLLEAPDDLRDNLEDMVNGFSPNVRRIFEKFSFMAMVDKLRDKGRLFHVVQAFSRVPMDLYSVSSHDMGKAFEELLRRFNDASPAGEQYTPRDAIHLMVDILFDGDDDVLSVPGAIRTMYDQTAGTGGMLSEAEEKVKALNPNAKLRLFGQELEDETYAICMADMLIRGQDPADIAMGDTLADDKHPDQRFDYQLSNPPYGVEWKPAEEAVKKEHAKGAAGRFGPGLPRISDGQMLFMLNAVAKMRPFINGEGGGRVGLVHNGSPLFTGDAGSGESEIRRYLLEHDYVEAIVALPTDMFYNTNIATYLWFLSNRKSKDRQDKVMLIDASSMGVLMKKNLGKKRFELSEDCQRRVVETFHAFKDVEWKDGAPIGGRTRALKAKVLPATHFFYRKVTIERPLRLRYELTTERKLAFIASLMGKKAATPVEVQSLVAIVDRLIERMGENLPHQLREKLDNAAVYLWPEVEAFAKLYFSQRNDQAFQAHLKQAHERYQALGREEQELFRRDAATYVSSYDFLSQLIDYGDQDLEKLHAFLKMLLPRLRGQDPDPVLIDGTVRLAGYKLVNKREHSLDLEKGEGKALDPLSGGGGQAWEDPKEKLSEIIKKIHGLFTGKYSDAEIAGWFNAVTGNVVADERIQMQAKANPTAGQFANGDYKLVLGEAIAKALASHHAMSEQTLQNPKVFDDVAETLLTEVYEKARLMHAGAV